MSVGAVIFAPSAGDPVVAVGAGPLGVGVIVGVSVTVGVNVGVIVAVADATGVSVGPPGVIVGVAVLVGVGLFVDVAVVVGGPGVGEGPFPVHTLIVAALL